MAGTIECDCATERALRDSASVGAYMAAGGKPDSAENQQIRRQLVQRELGECVSMLVSHFAQHPGALDGSDYDWDEDVLNICSQTPDHSARLEEIEERLEEIEERTEDINDDINELQDVDDDFGQAHQCPFWAGLRP